MERADRDEHGGGQQTIARSTGASPDAGLLTPGEVARLFGVDPKTVSRWADAGKLDALRTLGGHRRYREEQVRQLLDEGGV